MPSDCFSYNCSEELPVSLSKMLGLLNLITVQKDATYSVYYISVGSSTCFGCWHPSSGARTAVITACGIDEPDLLPSALVVEFPTQQRERMVVDPVNQYHKRMVVDPVNQYHKL